ncbi:hypothetical protein [Parasulfuritortus cantonensis]|uniref:hypothetical protein n=1 Tax=Parasulfuritortus cantonensis TaxID=2528202 RepID=UPI001404B330|nr:hypothetical protein [Parasulfuritortus cantonensis]
MTRRDPYEWLRRYLPTILIVVGVAALSIDLALDYGYWFVKLYAQTMHALRAATGK